MTTDRRDEAPLSSTSADMVDVTPPEDIETVDTSETVTPENFDFEKWLGGVRPTRRSVRLYPQAHLIARLEELADEIERTPDDVDVDALIDEFEETKRQFQDGVWFTVEKRSSEWVEKFRADLKAEKRLKINQDDENAADVMTALLHQLAAQIVVPTGVTVDGLRRLFETNEGELNKLVIAMTMVNQSLAEKASVVDVDFSQRRSTKRAKGASSGR